MVKGHNKTKVLRFNWLVVKQSRLSNSELGLFVARHFMAGDFITVCAGTLERLGADKLSKVAIKGRTVNLGVSPLGRRPFLFGAHFLDNPFYGMTPEERNSYEVKFFSGLKHYAEFDRLRIVGTLEISLGVRFF